ncbi:MAG: methylated-DNA--[protein]-cysteine S-methyltransferase [Rhodothermales bacterium]|nr:methylated-DNA--[protein]-cysteine S-methyltransferase [Rhodothermales bacterium]
MTYFHRIETPMGSMVLGSDGTHLTVASFSGEAESPASSPPSIVPDVLEIAETQFAEYFAGRRTTFDLSLAPDGTDFQRRVWDELMRIPFGERISYGELARRIGDRGAVRAVGAANGRNPIAVIIPCHRVVGADGSLTGYAGGLDRKRRLLELESRELKLFD